MRDLFLTVHPHCRDGSGARRTPALVGLHLQVPCRRCPADGQPPASPGTSRVSLEPHAVATQTLSVSLLGAPRKKTRKKTGHVLNRNRKSAAFRNSAPQFFDPHPPLPLGPQRCPLGTLATVRGTTAAVAPQDCNGRAAVHGALAPDRPVHTAVPREHSPNQYM